MLGNKLSRLHEEVRTYFPFVDRIAVALYDAKTGDIKTFLSSPIEESPVTQYRTALCKATWLNDLQRSRIPRVINEMNPSVLGNQRHSQLILGAGFKASYTVPVFDDAAFLGFIFFDSFQSHVFTERVVHQLDLFARILSLMIEDALRSVTVLTGGLHLLREISRFRDDETSSHLGRMSYYSELIARQLAKESDCDDEWVEYVRLFAPLHDIGKVATPDAILFKQSKLDAREFEVMKQHAVKGQEILSGLIRDLVLETIPHVETLLHIARNHHESWNGEGYPDRLSGEQIPLSARIIKVADVFDALTTKRCYKPAWPLDQATTYLREAAGIQFDPRCVETFLSRMDEIMGIMNRFAEQSPDATGISSAATPGIRQDWRPDSQPAVPQRI